MPSAPLRCVAPAPAQRRSPLGEPVRRQTPRPGTRLSHLTGVDGESPRGVTAPVTRRASGVTASRPGRSHGAAQRRRVRAQNGKSSGLLSGGAGGSGGSGPQRGHAATAAGRVSPQRGQYTRPRSRGSWSESSVHMAAEPTATAQRRRVRAAHRAAAAARAGGVDRAGAPATPAVGVERVETTGGTTNARTGPPRGGGNREAPRGAPGRRAGFHRGRSAAASGR